MIALSLGLTSDVELVGFACLLLHYQQVPQHFAMRLSLGSIYVEDLRPAFRYPLAVNVSNQLYV